MNATQLQLNNNFQTFTKVGESSLFKSINYPQSSLESTLKSLYLDSPEQIKIQKARKIMGDIVKGLSDTELMVFLTEFQQLVDEWMNEYEKIHFSGLTLQQALREE